MPKSLLKRSAFFLAALGLILTGCEFGTPRSFADNPRNVLFVGVDISGSFMHGKYFDDSMKFLAHYIYAHLKGYGGLEVPKDVFVGSIGGVKPDEPKTFYPIYTFQDKSIAEIEKQLDDIFPRTKLNKFTDYNAFFEQVVETVKNRKLVLRPISIVLMSDGIPDAPMRGGKQTFDKINLKPLENLSRNITVRLLYTDAVTGAAWQSKIKRRRVKVWTQDAAVMAFWKDPKILIAGKPFEKQERFFSWTKDNVDFGVRARSVP